MRRACREVERLEALLRKRDKAPAAAGRDGADEPRQRDLFVVRVIGIEAVDGRCEDVDPVEALARRAIQTRSFRKMRAPRQDAFELRLAVALRGRGGRDVHRRGADIAGDLARGRHQVASGDVQAIAREPGAWSEGADRSDSAPRMIEDRRRNRRHSLHMLPKRDRVAAHLGESEIGDERVLVREGRDR